VVLKAIGIISMIKTQKNTIRLLICILLLLTGCNSHSDAEGLTQNEFSKKFIPLTVGNISELEEVYAWKINERGDPISLILDNLDLNRLTIISEQSKILNFFSIDRGVSIGQQSIDIPNLRILGIDETGEKLLVGMAGQRLNERGVLQEYFHWIGLWNSTSDSLDECFTGFCEGELIDLDKIANAYIGATLDNETVVTYDEDGYSVTKLSPDDGGGIALVNSPDANYWWHIGKIAINSQHNQLVIVYEEGRIEIRKIHSSENWPLGMANVLAKGDKNQLETIEFALIDPGGNWLAVVRGKHLSIWSIGSWIKRETYQDQIDSLNNIKFNPTGELLFLALDNQIRIIGLNEEKSISSIQTPGIKSLSISDDNRMLVWGDENGNVHVLGIPIK
jgi:hypothetical protein